MYPIVPRDKLRSRISPESENATRKLLPRMGLNEVVDSESGDDLGSTLIRTYDPQVDATSDCRFSKGFAQSGLTTWPLCSCLSDCERIDSSFETHFSNKLDGVSLTREVLGTVLNEVMIRASQFRVKQQRP